MATKIIKLLKDGSFVTLAGHSVDTGCVDGSGSEARFHNVTSLACGVDNSVFAADRGRIRHINQHGIVTTIEIQAPPSTTMTGVACVCAHSDGSLFIADSKTSRLLKISSSDEPGGGKAFQPVGELLHSAQQISVDECTNTLSWLQPIFTDSSTIGPQVVPPGVPVAVSIRMVSLTCQKIGKWRAALRSQQFSDVTFKLGSECFHASRHTLAAHSDYFRSMFTQPMQESSASEIIVQDTSPQVFEALLVYIYSDHVLPLPPMQLIELAALADLHTIQDLADRCCKAVGARLTPSNVAPLLVSARRRGLLAIAKHCQQYLVSNAAVVAKIGGLDGLREEPELAIHIIEDLAYRLP